MKRSVYVVFGFILLLSCKSRDVSNDLISPETLIEVQKPSFEIEHMVFFTLKDSTTNAEISLFKERLRSLRRIKEVGQIFVAETQDLGDSRALDYDVVMTVSFRNRTEMEVYMDHPFHLIVKESLKPFLREAPATIDLMPE
ncbi:MAG: Dabb family protein [Bacteroidia bacterium]|nr:Dabb family protein [Bacteroidia bacterium]